MLSKNTTVREGRINSDKFNSRIKEIEAVIAQVKGVLSSQVVCENNNIVEIHILADHSRTPKQIVRDIESAILIKLGTAIDHKQISVAQLGEGGKNLTYPDLRPVLRRINCSLSEGEFAATVTISLGEEMFAATAQGPVTRQYRLRLAAEATLNAVEQYMGADNKFVAADVQRSSLGGQDIVVVVVSLCAGAEEEILAGAALNRGDEMEATARATLDAINRRLVAIDHD